MQFITEFITIATGINRYKVFEVDTNVYFCSPTKKEGEFWYNDHPEFYISFTNKKILTANAITNSPIVDTWLVEDAKNAIVNFLFEQKTKK